MKIHRTGYHLSDRTYDLLICGLLLLFSLILWWPSRYLPYFGGDVVSKTLVPSLLKTNILNSHLIIFPSLPLYLVAIYLLSKQYLSQFFALSALSIAAFSPLVLSKYFSIDLDLSLAAITMLLTYLLIRRNSDRYWLLGFPILAAGFWTYINHNIWTWQAIFPGTLLYLLPLIALFVSVIFQKISRLNFIPAHLLTILVLLIPFSQMLLWRGSTEPTSKYELGPTLNFSMLDKIRIFRELSLTIQSIAPQAELYGGFPESQMLTQPSLGYITHPLNFNSCDNYSYNSEVLQLIIIHPYAPSQLSCRRLLDTQKLIRLQHLEKNGKWIELYQVEASASATTP